MVPGGGGGGALTTPGGAPEDDDGGRVGPFPSWSWVYATVIVYTAALTVLLYVFTVVLDR